MVELVELCQWLTSDATLVEWVEKAAQPPPGLTEAQQKSAIARRLVREVGPEAVMQELDR